MNICENTRRTCYQFANLHSEIDTSSFSVRDSYLNSYVKYVKIDDLKNKLAEIEKLGDEWDKEYNTVGPTKEVLNFAREIIPELIEKDIIPYRMAPTVEEGLCMIFENSDMRLYLEIYNDGDIGYISENFKTKEKQKNEDITKDHIVPHLVSFFEESNAVIVQPFFSFFLNYLG